MYYKMKIVEFLYNLRLIKQQMPTRGGTYHLCWIAFVILVCVTLCASLSNCKDKTFRAIIIALWIWILLFETYKQAFYSAKIVDGEFIYNYKWQYFPFQLCSTPLYVLPLLGFFPEGKLRDAAAAYTMTYALIGGVAVFIYPMTVFSSSILANIHSMSHHAVQVWTGVFTAAWYRKRLNIRFYFRGLALFSVIYTIAMLFNTVLRDHLISIGKMTEKTNFNLFFVSPYMRVHSPLPSEVINSVSPWGVVFIYYLLLALGSAIIISVVWLLFGRSRRDSENVHERIEMIEQTEIDALDELGASGVKSAENPKAAKKTTKKKKINLPKNKKEQN